MDVSREKQLEQAKAALRAKRDLKKLDVYPGPRGSDTVRYGVQRKGRHLYWYIGEFQLTSADSLPGAVGFRTCSMRGSACFSD
jgi:hypothetical protein